jgi:hypothetical protein
MVPGSKRIGGCYWRADGICSDAGRVSGAGCNWGPSALKSNHVDIVVVCYYYFIGKKSKSEASPYI